MSDNEDGNFMLSENNALKFGKAKQIAKDESKGESGGQQSLKVSDPDREQANHDLLLKDLQ